VNQLHIGLASNIEFGKTVIDKCGIADDVGKILAHIIDPATRK
jgi:hypothetical protein